MYIHIRYDIVHNNICIIRAPIGARKTYRFDVTSTDYSFPLLYLLLYLVGDYVNYLPLLSLYTF